MLEDLPDGFLHALLLLLPGNDSLQLSRASKTLRQRVLAAPALNASVTVGVSMLEVRPEGVEGRRQVMTMTLSFDHDCCRPAFWRGFPRYSSFRSNPTDGCACDATKRSTATRRPWLN